VLCPPTASLCGHTAGCAHVSHTAAVHHVCTNHYVRGYVRTHGALTREPAAAQSLRGSTAPSCTAPCASHEQPPSACTIANPTSGRTHLLQVGIGTLQAQVACVAIGCTAHVRTHCMTQRASITKANAVRAIVTEGLLSLYCSGAHARQCGPWALVGFRLLTVVAQHRRAKGFDSAHR
jgi:hypothetical protein